MISWLDTAATTGFSSYRIPSNISLGSVGFEPDTNMAITISSNDVRNAKIAPLAMPGQRSGSITCVNVRSGPAPRLRSARSSDRSSLYRTAVTLRTTNGSARTVWASTRPVAVPMSRQRA